ncbi:MAG: hypothetical protein ACI32N_07815 [Bulleidia sp.]
MENQFEKRLNNIIEETTQCDFPLLMRDEEKRQFIIKKRESIENEIQNLPFVHYPEQAKLEKLWKESIDFANDQFSSLPMKHKLNGFYLQELLHCYAIKMVKEIMKEQ